MNYRKNRDEQLVCPFCKNTQHTHYPELITAIEKQTECERCGKVFRYTVCVIRTYQSYKPAEDNENAKRSEHRVHT